ncbi:MULTISPECIES: FecR family protein [Butyricimonas]|uniref:FecR family protein n=1 Tax=Butyricimonas TaxID=574697 RepID=UPI001D0646D3|nr:MULTISPECIES: FecR family protein [Butyricimonas]MCB6971746.1 FecR domain-containing protein [Butyricimonas synergistica]MCG4518647.1 FecR domain-containing protein [Butyricimonas sp. DFI.6.44]
MEDIESRLMDFFLGELDKEEEKEILHQVETDEEFRKIFIQVRSKHLDMRWGARGKLVKGDVHRVKRLIKRRRLIKVGMRVAAVFVLLLGVGILWMPSDSKVEEFAQEHQITPGKNQAYLYLSNGKSVLLSRENRELREDNGVSISVSAEGKVHYNVEEKDGAARSLFNRLVVPRGGEFMITLEDGTKVWLDAETELRYPTNFDAQNRVVYLKGEAYFEVAKMEGKPFVVKIDQMSVNVLGTKFNVNNREAGVVQTVLVEGSVKLKSPRGEVLMVPNQKAEYHGGDEWVVEEVDVSPYVAWKDGNFVFNNESLERIMNKLSSWYDVDVFYANEEVKNVKLTGDMMRYKDIQELLYFFEKISDVKFLIKNRTVTVSYK